MWKGGGQVVDRLKVGRLVEKGWGHNLDKLKVGRLVERRVHAQPLQVDDEMALE